jgi:hypothetical protein
MKDPADKVTFEIPFEELLCPEITKPNTQLKSPEESMKTAWSDSGLDESSMPKELIELVKMLRT